MPAVAAVLLVLLAVMLAVVAAITLSGRRSELEGDVDLPSVPPSAVPATVAPVEPSPSPSGATPSTAPTVADPHALLVVESKIATTPPYCVNVDRLGTRDGSSRRVVDCAESLEVTRDGTSAAIAGPRAMSIVDLRDGHELGTIDTGQYTFPTAWSPSGRWLLWSSCRKSRSDSESCSVILSARDGSGQHELYRGDDGYASSITWLPDESRVVVPTDGSGSVLVGVADGSDLRPVAPGGPEYGWAGAVDASVIDVAPDGRSYLYLDGPPRADCGSICMDALKDVMSQGLSEGANDGPPMNLTNLAPGQFAVATAWSPDGRTLAFLRKTIDPAVDKYEQQGTLRAAPAELWLRDASGTIRRIDGVALPEPQDEGAETQPYRIHWSPDGTRLAIEAGNGRPGTAASIDTYLVAVEGPARDILRDTRSVAWSPDGTELALVHQAGPFGHRPSDPAAPVTIEVAGADGADRRQVAVPPVNVDFDILWATD